MFLLSFAFILINLFYFVGEVENIEEWKVIRIIVHDEKFIKNQ